MIARMIRKSAKAGGGEKGAALIIAMMILVSISFLGLFAIRTTSVDLLVSGNERLNFQTFHAADGGTQLGSRVLRDLLNSYSTVSYGGIVLLDESCFRNEIYGFPGDCNDKDTDTPSNDPDMTFPDFTQHIAVNIDVDQEGSVKFLPGSGMEFSSEYEGTGSGAAKGGTAVTYSIFAQSEGSNNATSLVDIRYRHGIGMPGGS